VGIKLRGNKFIFIISLLSSSQTSPSRKFVQKRRDNPFPHNIYDIYYSNLFLSKCVVSTIGEELRTILSYLLIEKYWTTKSIVLLLQNIKSIMRNASE
jgi:hypothetical protein